MRSAPAAVLAALAVGLVGAPPAEACGLPLGAKIPFEQALVSFSGGREEIVTSLQLEGDGPRAAVLFPVPAVPGWSPPIPRPSPTSTRSRGYRLRRATKTGMWVRPRLQEAEST